MPLENFEPVRKKSPLLITGAAGFIGKNLAANLRAAGYENLLLYDLSSTEETLAAYTKQAAFVFHLAGVNRPKDAAEFYAGNADLTTRMCQLLEEAKNPAPILLSSTIQAGNGTDYALSKEAAETAVFRHSAINDSPVFVFRLPGVFGKWSRPSYNSVVATFCHNVARGLPIAVRDPAFSLPLCYIDDVVDAFMRVMLGEAEPVAAGHFFAPAVVHETTLGRLAELVTGFKASRETLAVPDLADPFVAKLYATYLSFLPQENYAYPLPTHADGRGSFTEFLRTPDRGQVSINVAKPGVVKGNHWHNTKNEKFLVVSGEAVIRFRTVGDTEVTEYRVSGSALTVVDIPTGATHNIENVGEGDLVTVMWASEAFDPDRPDTFFEEV